MSVIVTVMHYIYEIIKLLSANVRNSQIKLSFSPIKAQMTILHLGVNIKITIRQSSDKLLAATDKPN